MRLSSRLRLEQPESPSEAPACFNVQSRDTRPATPPGFNTWPGLGSSQFARRYYGNRFYFLFLQVLRWFNSLSSIPYGYEFTVRTISSTDIRFSHSEISGSKLACSSPKLIAAGHVFLQSLAPRHPPCALYNLLLLALDHRFFITAPESLRITLTKDLLLDVFSSDIIFN